MPARRRSGFSLISGQSPRLTAVWDEDAEHRGLLLDARFPAEIAQPFSERAEAYVLEPEQHREILGATELGRGGDPTRAPSTLADGRIGFLVAGAPTARRLGELQLKMLAGMAGQAIPAVSRSRAPSSGTTSAQN